MVKLRRLRHVRERKALTQEELAAQAGISRTALSRIESGVTEPRPSTLRKLADALGVEPEALIGPEEDQGKALAA
jgi:transcriptional regulator with XRE-family HTH domain